MHLNLRQTKQNQGCLLKVDVHCEACKMKILQIMGSITGVYSVTINAQEGTLEVSGEVDPNILLRALARAGRHAEVVWVKLKHPALNMSTYDNGYGSNGYDHGYGSYGSYSYDNGYGSNGYDHGYGSYGSYDYDNGHGSYGYRAIDEPYGYISPLYERPYYDTHQYYPMRRAVMEGLKYNTTVRYGFNSSPRARYVPGYPPPTYDPYYDEYNNFCSVM